MKLITRVFITIWVQLAQRLCHQFFLSVIFRTISAHLNNIGLHELNTRPAHVVLQLYSQ